MESNVQEKNLKYCVNRLFVGCHGTHSICLYVTIKSNYYKQKKLGTRTRCLLLTPAKYIIKLNYLSIPHDLPRR